MPEAFDPYRKWLGIPPKDQPPNHYRLLGIAHFEDDPDVIENAASRQMAHVRTFQGGKHSADSQRILNELTSAKLCLLQSDKKAAYDAALRQHLEATGQLSSTTAPEAPVEEEPNEYPPPPPGDFRPGKRWRTGTDIEPPVVSTGPAPVPIPMPASPPAPASFPEVGSPGIGAPVIRRGSSSVGRGRKSSSSGPIFLILGSVALVAVAIVVAVMMAMKPPASANHVKSKPSSPEKSTEKPPLKENVINPSFSTGNESRRPRPRPPRTESVNNRNLNPSPPTVLAEPKDELLLAREALARRNDGDFTLHISQAESLIAQKKPANAQELEADEAHLREVDKLLSQFWQAVRDGADKKIPKGERFKFRKHEMELVKREGDQLTYKFDGKEEVAAIKKLPARVATTIAYRAFGNDDPSGKIALAVFLTIDAEAASDQASKRLAIKLLDDIRKAGEANHPVLSRELGKDLKPMPHPDDDFSPPTILGVSGSKPLSPNPMSPSSLTLNQSPATETTPKFDPMKLKEAREKFERRFNERMLHALEHNELAKPLFKELTEAASGDETAEFKVQLLSKANELAAQLGDSDSIVKLSEQIGKLTGERPVEIQLRLFTRCSLEGASAPKDLLKNAQAASMQAQEGGNLYAAIELAKIALRAAQKASLAVESNRLEGRLEELQALQEKARDEKK